MKGDYAAVIAMLACGAAVVMLFDIFRSLRAAIKNNAFFVAAEDILFWILSIEIISVSLWISNSGKMRAFEAISIIIGAVLYILLFQRVILGLFTFIFKKIFKIINLILQILLTPLTFLYKILLVPLYNRIKKLKYQKGKINEKSQDEFSEIL